MSVQRQILGLRLLAAAFSVWMCASVALAQRQPRYDPQEASDRNAEMLILRQQIATNRDIAQINSKLAVVESTAHDARGEVKEIRNMMYGIAGTLLVSLIMQVAAIKRVSGRRSAWGKRESTDE